MSKNTTWSIRSLPSFRDLKVHVLPGPGFAALVSLFCAAGAKRADSVDEAGLVVFLGGVDVNPALYGEKPVPEVTSFNETRDAKEKEIYEQCVRKGVPMFGICRGAQFLHVMNGGKLWQHVDSHLGHHIIYDIEEDVVVTASSTHHQMMRYDDDLGINLIAITEDPVAETVKAEDGVYRVEDDAIIEIEAAFFSQTKCLCIQGHPEYGPDEFTSWSFHKLHDLLTCDWSEDAPDQVFKALA